MYRCSRCLHAESSDSEHSYRFSDSETCESDEDVEEEINNSVDVDSGARCFILKKQNDFSCCIHMIGSTSQFLNNAVHLGCHENLS